MRDECKILFHAVPAGPPYYTNGPMIAQGHCETHGIQVPDPYNFVGLLCPIGRIEKAVEDGIARVEAALSYPTVTETSENVDLQGKNEKNGV